MECITWTHTLHQCRCGRHCHFFPNNSIPWGSRILEPAGGWFDAGLFFNMSLNPSNVDEKAKVEKNGKTKNESFSFRFLSAKAFEMVLAQCRVETQ